MPGPTDRLLRGANILRRFAVFEIGGSAKHRKLQRADIDAVDLAPALPCPFRLGRCEGVAIPFGTRIGMTVHDADFHGLPFLHIIPPTSKPTP